MYWVTYIMRYLLDGLGKNVTRRGCVAEANSFSLPLPLPLFTSAIQLPQHVDDRLGVHPCTAPAMPRLG